MKSVRLVMNVRGHTMNLYVSEEGRVRLAGDMLEITDKLTHDEHLRVLARAEAKGLLPLESASELRRPVR